MNKSKVRFPYGFRYIYTPDKKTTCPVQKRTLNGKVWESNINKLLISLCDKNKYSIDIGANIGVHSISMREHSKGLIAIEPQQEIFNCLEKTMNNSYVDELYLFNDLLSNKIEEVIFYQDNTGRSRIPIEGEKYKTKHWNKIIKETKVLDDLFDYGSMNIGLIKLDVEGHEFKVLEGCVKIISTYRPKILIEVFDKNVDDLYKWSNINDYSIQSISKVGDFLLLPN